jgi:hypothetical protein
LAFAQLSKTIELLRTLSNFQQFSQQFSGLAILSMSDTSSSSAIVLGGLVLGLRNLIGRCAGPLAAAHLEESLLALLRLWHHFGAELSPYKEVKALRGREKK